MQETIIKSHILDIIKWRRSVRKYAQKPIEPEKMDLIMEAARLAPSSCNTQPWHFIIVDDKKLHNELAKCAPIGTHINNFIMEAPVSIIACTKPHLLIHSALQMVDKDCHKLDIAIALEHIVLVASDLGIGTCWIGWFSEKPIKKLLNIPKNIKVIALLTLGYPKEENTIEAIGGIRAKPRKSKEEIFSYNRFNS